MWWKKVEHIQIGLKTNQNMKVLVRILEQKRDLEIMVTNIFIFLYTEVTLTSKGWYITALL